MDTTLILLQGAVVILAILLGVRMGGIGLGLWGLVGLAILVFGFGLPPGDPPTTSMFIILMVITAASTMQSVGGIDYLVEVAKKLLKRKPAYIALIAPIVAFVFTMGAGTGFIYYSLIPVIFAVAYANKVRPERPLAVAGTASQFAITASPVSAAMATLVGLLDPVGFGIGDILIVVLPASIVGLLVACFVQMRVGKELDDDPEYQRRVAAGEIAPFDESVLEERELPPYAKRSTMIFLAGIGVIVVLGMVERLRPAFPDEAGNLVPLSTGIIIQIVMGVVATVIVLTCRVNIKDVVGQSTMMSGLIGLIALFGIAWLADTWIAANETAIVNAMGSVVEEARWTIALAIFIVGALTTSQAAALAAIVPIGLALGVPPQFLAVFSTACIGIYFFPANGSQVTSIATDETGTTHISKYAIWHSFSLSMFIMWLVSTVGRHDRRDRRLRHVGGAGGSVMSRTRTGWVAAGATLVALVPIVPAHRRRAGRGRLRRLHPERDVRRADRRSAGQARRRRRPRHRAVPGEDRRPATRPSSSATTGRPGCPGSASRRSTPTSSSRWSSPTPTTATRWRAATSSSRMPTGSARPASPSCNSCRSETPTVQGVAVIERAPLQRELDVTPTRVRVLLSSGGRGQHAAEPVAGFDGYIQGGTCESPGDRLRVQLKSRGDHDVEPFLAEPDGSGEPVTVAYYGAPGAPGFGLAAAYTDQVFSLVVTDTESGDPVACGDILEPDDDDFADAGLALVQLLPVGDPGVQGFALIERIALQRELDVTPTRVRILLFAPPVTTT